MKDTADEIRAAVLKRFAKIAVTPGEEKKFPVGPGSCKALGYETQEIDALPSSVTESFCGVGNPIGLGELHLGQTVVDLGSGAGLDSILAARRIGLTGRVFGIDMTEVMIEKARRNARLCGLENIEFFQSRLEDIPLKGGIADVAVSNGVFNLCPDKPRVLAEVYRILRPGGRLQMADILLDEQVTPEEVAQKGTWSD